MIFEGRIFGTHFAVLIVCSCLNLNKAVTIVDHPDDEYYIDHEISRKTAIEEAKMLELYTGPIPGCRSCSYSEMIYCKDDVINDHCCCDHWPDDEVFKFVPHICRIGPEACRVMAGDCAEYTRLRTCCCHDHLAEKWKKIASNANSTTIKNHYLYSLLMVLFVVLYNSNNFG